MGGDGMGKGDRFIEVLYGFIMIVGYELRGLIKLSFFIWDLGKYSFFF